MHHPGGEIPGGVFGGLDILFVARGVIEGEGGGEEGRGGLLVDAVGIERAGGGKAVDGELVVIAGEGADGGVEVFSLSGAAVRFDERGDQEAADRAALLVDGAVVVPAFRKLALFVLDGDGEVADVEGEGAVFGAVVPARGGAVERFKVLEGALSEVAGVDGDTMRAGRWRRRCSARPSPSRSGGRCAFQRSSFCRTTAARG